LEIETEKTTNVVEAPFEGFVRRIVLDAGVKAPVGALAGVLAEPEISETEVDAFVESYAHRMAEAGEHADTRPVPRVVESRRQQRWWSSSMVLAVI
jgi:pyruvate dehydrogenase E2 component (dihydrolipoamide acetyltransferase)